MMSKADVICFGEILWDVFPNRKVIGGAPLNVALRLHSYGAATKIISCIGKDENGKGVTDHLLVNGVTTQLVQTHPQLETGTVQVTLDEGGSASYEISLPVAWDAIKLTPELISEVKQSPFFLFGSLAVRGATNRKTLQALLDVANTKIFDVNLRPPHYDISMVYELMQQADLIKLNDEELEEVCNRLGCQEAQIEAQINWLAEISRTPSICVTLGGEGAVLLYERTYYQQGGFEVTVKDTVGAGDSFLATLINELLIKNAKPSSALNRACAVGALVASKEGANCSITTAEIEHLLMTQ